MSLLLLKTPFFLLLRHCYILYCSYTLKDQPLRITYVVDCLWIGLRSKVKYILCVNLGSWITYNMDLEWPYPLNLDDPIQHRRVQGARCIPINRNYDEVCELLTLVLMRDEGGKKNIEGWVICIFGEHLWCILTHTRRGGGQCRFKCVVEISLF